MIRVGLLYARAFEFFWQRDSMVASSTKQPLQQLKNRVLNRLLDLQSLELTRSKQLVVSLIKIGWMVAQGFIDNLLKLQAMALAFKTLLSLAPFLAVIFSVLKAFGVHNRMQPALFQALAPLGEKGEEIAAYLLGFVNKMSAGALGSVGLVTLFITALSLLGTIEESFNHIWRVKAPRKLTRKFSDYLSVVLVGPVLVFAALTITATLQSNAFVQRLLALEPFGTVILSSLRLVPYLTLWGAFAFIYVFVPNTRVKLSSALVGGLVAAVLWETVGWGFAVFVASSTRYYAIYSSFAILLLFLLWLHIGWVIVLLGAQVAYAHQNLNFFEAERDRVAESPAGRERLGLYLMFLIARNFYDGLDPLGVAELATRSRLPLEVVGQFMKMFAESRLLFSLADEERFVLGRDPERIRVKEILDCVRHFGEKRRGPGTAAKERRKIDEMLAEIDRSVAETLEGITLQDLILGQGPPSSRSGAMRG
jgi:membrane protein